jgi:hypothetical protein
MRDVNEDNMRVQSRSFLVILLSALWLLAACAPPPGPTPTPAPEETNLPFETIERGDYAYYYFGHPNEPQRVFLIRSAEEAAQLSREWVSQQAITALAQLDYRRYFAIALFRGQFASSGYDAVIQRVGRQDNRLVVHIQFWSPSPYYEVTAAASSPYHLIKVLRDGRPLDEASLVLETQTVTPTPPAEIRRLTPGSVP